MADARKGDNRMLRDAGGGGNGALPTMHFFVESSNGSYPRSDGIVGSGAPRTME